MRRATVDGAAPIEPAAPSLNEAADELIQALEATGPLLGLRHSLLTHLRMYAGVIEARGESSAEATQLLWVWLAFDGLVDAVHSRREGAK